MVDHARLNSVLTEFAHTLVRRYEVGEVLYQLTDRTVEVLGITGVSPSWSTTSRSATNGRTIEIRPVPSAT
jgi:hypothetical protein